MHGLILSQASLFQPSRPFQAVIQRPPFYPLHPLRRPLHFPHHARQAASAPAQSLVSVELPFLVSLAQLYFSFTTGATNRCAKPSSDATALCAATVPLQTRYSSTKRTSCTVIPTISAKPASRSRHIPLCTLSATQVAQTRCIQPEPTAEYEWRLYPGTARLRRTQVLQPDGSASV